MLASTAPDVAAAYEKLDGGEVCVDTKLDGIRVQVHKDGDEVWVFTRSLDDITARLTDVVAVARRCRCETAILDGEAIALDDAGRPRPFQETASLTARRLRPTPGAAGGRRPSPIRPFFFDCLHVDGEDLLDLPLPERLARLDQVVAGDHTVEPARHVGRRRRSRASSPTRSPPDRRAS